MSERIEDLPVAVIGGCHLAANAPETDVCSTDFAGTGEECCGDPAQANPNACCVADATAIAAGKTGCGCG